MKRRRIIAAICALILLGGGTSWFFLSGSQTPVPSVAGKTVSEATSTLQSSGFQTSINQEFSETVANGTVIDTEPSGGLSVDTGSTITLNVSKGQERYLVPMDLKGKDINTATTELQDLTLVVASPVEQVFDDKVPVGSVVSTKPVGGTKVKRNAEVTLYVSKGPKPIIVPPIAGLDITKVTADLTKLGLVVQVATQVFDQSPVGSVITSNPVPGTTVKKGDTVALTVSKGPPPVQVPSVVGLDVASAKSILTKAGFKVNVQNQLATVVLNKVYSQDPAGGGMATPGSTITIKIV